MMELVRALCEAEKTILSSHAAIKGLPYNAIGQKRSSRFYYNSDGAMRVEEKTSAYAYLYTRTEEAGRRSRSAGSTVVASGVAGLDLKKCAAEAIEKTISHLNYEKVTSGKYTVVFSPNAFLDIIGSFGNAFDAQRILDKQSLSKEDAIGTKLSSDLFCLYDDPLHPSNVGASTFDSEGTPTQKIAIVEKGTLVSFLHSAGTAKRFNVRPTGNANIGSKVTVGAHFLHVARAPGTVTERSLDKEITPIVYVDEVHALHAGINALEGAFSLPFDGYLIKNGKRVSIEAATVAGDFFTLLRNICFLGHREVETPSGVCPEVWVTDISIAGE